MRVIFTVSFILLTFIVVFMPAYLGPDSLKGCDAPGAAKCEKADAIVAISGGDTTARTEEAIELYRAGWAPLLIFSGAARDKSGPSNAEAMKQYALQLGIPDEDIVIEEFSQNTAENAVNTSLFVKERNIRRIVLVTSAYHERRAMLEFEVRLPEVSIATHPIGKDRDSQWNQWWWLSFNGWQLALSEVAKIIIFYINRGPVA